MIIRINRNSHPIATLLMCVYAVCIFTPYITDYYLIIPCLVGAGFFALTFFSYIRELGRNQLILFLTLMMMISVAYRVLGVSTANWGNYIIRFLMFVSIWAGVYSQKYFTEKSRKIVLTVAIIALLINLIDNFQIHNQYPDIYPTMKGTEYFETRWGRSNVGATSWVYCVAIVSIGFLLTRWYRTDGHDQPIWKKFFLITAFGVSAVFVVMYGNSGTVLLSFIATILLVYIVSHRDSRARYIWAISGVLLLAFLFFTPALKEFSEVIRSISGDKVANRIGAVANLFSGEMTRQDEDYMTRLYYLGADLQSWFKNILTFFFGRGYHTRSAATAEDMIALNGAGNHSGIFDLVARYGLLGLTVLFYLLKHGRAFLLGNCKDVQKKRVFSVLWVILIINSVMNNIFSYNILFLVFFAVPLYMHEKPEQNLVGGKP